MTSLGVVVIRKRLTFPASVSGSNAPSMLRDAPKRKAAVTLADATETREAVGKGGLVGTVGWRRGRGWVNATETREAVGKGGLVGTVGLVGLIG
jgi:hypothetical protein